MQPQGPVIEEFFDLRIATILLGEEEPEEAHLLRVPDPTGVEVRRAIGQGWFYKPCYVTYVLPVPTSLDEYIENVFRSRNRNKPRRLLREVPERYRLVVEKDASHLAEFSRLYKRTVADRPRGKNRLAEHETSMDFIWHGYYLFDGEKMVAGVLVHEMDRHISVAYGAFDPGHRKLDLEEYLILQVLEGAIGRGFPILSLGMDTNRYGHHLSLRLPAYKLRLGFTPMAFEPAGRELVKVQRFDVFEEGLFFYAYENEELVGRYFARKEPDLRPFQHATTPRIETHLIKD